MKGYALAFHAASFTRKRGPAGHLTRFCRSFMNDDTLSEWRKRQWYGMFIRSSRCNFSMIGSVSNSHIGKLSCSECIEKDKECKYSEHHYQNREVEIMTAKSLVHKYLETYSSTPPLSVAPLSLTELKSIGPLRQFVKLTLSRAMNIA